ncbi:MAG: carbohydrate ABC transporter permease [Devosia sp.]|uniref:carbohydrate ABC transporter permease n=1 Tax=Devosia sp. 66-22 TaxID=1895753 RepID=UPI000A57BBF7|nr:carbohydrate ABC transporter permease [Devosia sp. 66-22]MBN9346550.1 carbohydrate ABC transporter permease [Devosia sp.]
MSFLPNVAERPAPAAVRTEHLRRRIGEHAGTYTLYAALLLIVLFPLSWVILGSFKNPSEIFAYPTTFFPRDFTLSNYADVIRRTALPTYLINTAIVTAFTLVFTLVIGTIAAYGFSRWNFPFKNTILVTLLILQLIPSTVNIIPYYLMMNWFGLLNTRTALVLIYTATHVPFTIWIMKGYFDTLPRSLDEAAVIDGCSMFRVFWSIILPLSLPGLSAAGFLVFIGAWSEFLVPLVIANSRDVAVMSVGLYSFFGMDATAYHYAFAASVMSTAPVVIAYLFAQRYLISGLASGTDK